MKIMKTMVLVAVMLLGGSVPASASPCGKDATDEADKALWEANEGCSRAFILWQYKAYHMFYRNWGGWGFNNACDLEEPFTKAVNGSFLLTYGLTDNRKQWHGSIDYRRTGESVRSPVHNRVVILPENTRKYLAEAKRRRTRLGCLLFDDGEWSNSPTTRAGDYVHEGWHHWQFKNRYKGHMNGPIGACTLESKGCDWYYSHGEGAFGFGEVHKYTKDGKFFHSPTQLQAEYLCDVADFGESWLPNIVVTRASMEANTRLANRFRNAVAYRCGDPRPF